MLPIDFQGQLTGSSWKTTSSKNRNNKLRKIIDYYERKLVELAGDVVGLDKVEMENISFH